MLCILLVVAYPYDRLLELPGAPERNYNHFQWQAANLQENKSETLNKRILCSIYLFIFWRHKLSISSSSSKQKRKKTKASLQLTPKIHAICLPDTNQKEKICIIDDTDAVNLLAHIFWAHTEHINTLGPLRHKGWWAELSDIPARRSHLHWRQREAQSSIFFPRRATQQLSGNVVNVSIK